MRYAILYYDSEDEVNGRAKSHEDAVMARVTTVEKALAGTGRLVSVARLLPTTTATTVRHGRGLLIIDGPFAKTEEQLLGLYVVDCASLNEAIETAKELRYANGSEGTYELRPLTSNG